MITIAIIDVIGLAYDGTTLGFRGLGGSESAVILMAKELARIGFDVTVFNNCLDSEASPGVCDNVKYVDLSSIPLMDSKHLTFDVVISSRTVIPFLHPALWGEFAQYHPERFKRIKDNAKFRAVWMHDTFCNGDHHLEGMVTHGDIHEIFTLSDFHTSYVTTCDHGGKRMFEVLKNKVFVTRNGMVNYNHDVDIAAKDPDLFVYNASVTKGMLPLVQQIWPKFKERAPNAKLIVIGGYYRFRENAEPDAQEKQWRELVNDPYYASIGIQFTGVIKQSEIAEILSRASYMAFPAAFPETFGISSLESLTYNTPLITCRFGALEETAIDSACYKIDYPIEPNGLFPRINATNQVSAFVDLMTRAYNDKYLHQQKMYACNAIKDIATWDTVALQWKQHIFRVLGKYLPRKEYQRVMKINSRVHSVFGRRFSNREENYIPRNQEQRIVVITPVYNAAQYIGRCITSVKTQDYTNWKMIVIDDGSTDDTLDVIVAHATDDERIHVIPRLVGARKGAVFNHVNTIRTLCDSSDIVILLDGDDALVNNPQIFHMYNNMYHEGTEFTYGSCWSIIDNIPLVAQHYPEHIKATKAYRQHKFAWNMPYTHLRTMRAHLIKHHPSDAPFKDENGEWYKAGGDGAVFYTAIERARPNAVKVVTDIVCMYNDINPLNDYKVNSDEQTRNANRILTQ